MSNEVATKQDAAIMPITNPLELLQTAIDRGVDPSALEKLMDLAERHDKSVAEKAFASAMTEAQSKIGRIAADSKNKQTHSEYASYAALDRVVRPIYTEHGFSLSFDTEPSPIDNHVCVLCYVSHTAGHSKTYRADMPADGKGAKGGDVMTKTHAVGSAMQYGMRYLLKLIFNIAIGEDDDGNGASLEPITGEQSADLYALIEDAGADKAAFLKWAGVESIELIPAENFHYCVKMLERKRNQ